MPANGTSPRFCSRESAEVTQPQSDIVVAHEWQATEWYAPLPTIVYAIEQCELHMTTPK